MNEEFEAELYEIEQERADPYNSIPFGDAQRFEDEQVARDRDWEEIAESDPDRLSAALAGADYLVICSGTQVFGLWADPAEVNSWLGEFHCLERRMQDGRFTSREDWHCEKGQAFAEHNIVKIQTPYGHKEVRVW